MQMEALKLPAAMKHGKSEMALMARVKDC